MNTDGKFYTLMTDSGNKTINIENIAAIEDINSQTTVTLNVTDNSGKNVRFIAKLPWQKLSADISVMSEKIWKR